MFGKCSGYAQEKTRLRIHGRGRLCLLLVLRGSAKGLAGTDETRTVEDDEQAGDRVDQGGPDRTQVASNRKIYTNGDERQADCKVLVHQHARLTGKADEERNPAKVVVHKGDGGGLDGDVASERPHGDANVTGRKGGSVIDAVADDRDDVAALLELAHNLRLLLGKASGVDLRDANLLGDRIRDALVVTSDHAATGNPHLVEILDRLGSHLAHGVLKANPAKGLAVTTDADDGHAVTLGLLAALLQGGDIDADLGKPAETTDIALLAADGRLDTLARNLLVLVGDDDVDADLGGKLLDGDGRRVVGVVFDGDGVTLAP